MQAYWWWWGLAVLLGMFEMLTATFYLLVLGAGFAAGGFVAWAGGDLAWQLLVAAAVSVVGWFMLRRLSPRRERSSARASRDVHLDIGERVRVDRWQPDRRTQVVYRGAEWAAELEPGDTREPQPGDHVIRRIEGSRLILARPGPTADSPAGSRAAP
jgi:membrane protein implicated in regulation of membrane protease activity